MNIKRAFLAAVAVLLVPGYAMAQSTNTFATSVTAAGGGDAGTPSMTITCNGGIPLTQTAPAGTTFSVTELTNGTVCNVGLSSDLDTGWVAGSYTCSPSGTASASGCAFTVADGNTAWSTDVSAVPAPFDFEVTFSWDVSDDADPDITAGAMIVSTCFDVWDTATSSLTDAGPLSTDASDAAGGTFSAFEGLTADPNGSTECTAMWEGVASAVEPSAACTEDVDVGDTVVTCSLSATAFFEGIPTLSQYGMAIMVLLMLGVGFVGFRRFV